MKYRSGTYFSLGLCAASVILAPAGASAEPKDVYSEINVTGTIDVAVTAAHAPACARMWWVKRLTGSVEQLGDICGLRKLEIPSFLGISLASKLRASAVSGVTVQVVGSSERSKQLPKIIF